MDDNLKRLIKALVEGDKIDKYNKPYLKAVLTQYQVSLADVITNTPELISQAYDTQYKSLLERMLEYEFRFISKDNIIRVVEENCYRVEPTRHALQNYEQRMKSGRVGRLDVEVPNKYPSLVQYYNYLTQRPERKNSVLDKWPTHNRAVPADTQCCISLEPIKQGVRYCLCSSQHNSHCMSYDQATQWCAQKMECPMCRSPIIACVYTNL